MVLDIKMCRFDNVPWGFRLVGGADYDYPLTVVKVTEGSIADEAGLRVEDIIVRINDTAAMPLTHDEAHRLIMNSGSVFYFGVYREFEEEVFECPKRFPTSESSLTKSPTPTPTATPPLSLSPTPSLLRLAEAANARTPELRSELVEAPVEERRQAMSEVHSEDNREEGGDRGGRLYLPELPDRPCSALSERAEIKLVEEEIAAVLSGETEVLKEHSVLGLFPKPGVCMASDVLRSLNEEVTKTKLEKDKENRKWSTFLQRPDRPVPKSKQQLEAERRAANAYKVTIVKSAPRGSSPMPEAKPAPKEATPPAPEEVKQEEVKEEPAKEQETEEEEKEEEPLPTDSEVPNLEQLPQGEEGAQEDEDQQEKADAPKDVSDGLTEAEAPPAASDEATEPGTPAAPPSASPPPKSEEEQALERQLADVQKQLAALSTLPSTIQSTLDAVTKQLADLLPTFKLQQQPQAMPQIDEGLGEEGEEPSQAQCQPQSQSQSGSQMAAGEMEDAGNGISISGADKPLSGPCENNENRCDANDLEVAEISRSTDDNRQDQEQQQQAAAKAQPQEQELSEEQSFKKQKKHDVIEELEEHLVRKNNPRRSKRAFGPLVPSSERPLVLPGGRRWYRPKDAYNDEFIAETLSAQAELITGSTLGCPYESPLLGYDARVNFMKYQKPERKIDLNRSEVYKYLNPHLDRAPVRGIEVRAPLVAAESDIRQAVQS
ncbi:nucleolar protein dao-5 isoform X2 [Drosophila subobscura]|uniref:nucleolar protein dao-5 isoform X2 n=1 Tax=Drosophila subobscura TaxID=7241 RepID=UPI00155AA945|nr:nucleolar protein dao-5 isoform X2 [Drosophila subobscura]